MIGAYAARHRLAEDRDLFRRAMADIGLEKPPARRIAHSMGRGLACSESGFSHRIGRRSPWAAARRKFAYNREESRPSSRAARCVPTNEVLLEESVLGWKKNTRWRGEDRQRQLLIVVSSRKSTPWECTGRLDHGGASPRR